MSITALKETHRIVKTVVLDGDDPEVFCAALHPLGEGRELLRAMLRERGIDLDRPYKFWRSTARPTALMYEQEVEVQV
jgi:hypothetical protein